MSWLGGVGVPYLALLAFAVLKRPTAGQELTDQVFEFGIDLCVLGLGVSGALFANERVEAKFGARAPTVAVAVLLLDLIIAGICLRQREQEWNARTKASISIFLGIVILGINSTVALMAS